MRATTFEEVSSGALENPDVRLDTAINLAHSALQGLRCEGLMAGAILFGSAFTDDLFQERDINLLSDLDVLVISVGNSYKETAGALRDVSTRVLGVSAVHLEVTWLTEEQAQSDDHTVTLPMHTWLQRQVRLHPEAVVGKDPTELISPLDVDLNEHTDEWFRTTRSRLQKNSVSPHQTFPWALSMPHIAARRSIDVLKHTKRVGQTTDIPLSVTREGIRNAVRTVYGEYDPELWKLYQEAEVIQRRYLSFLIDEVSRGIVTRDEYDVIIEGIADEAVPKALELLSSMHEAFNNVGYPVYDDAYFTQVTEANMRTPTHPYHP